MAPVPKSKETRQRWAKRPEIGVVPADRLPALIPEPPKGLLKITRERWESYWRSPVAAAVEAGADWGRLERWIRAVDEWHRVGAEFRKRRLVDGSMGQPVLNPLAAYLQNLENTIAKAEAELGLTPMARLKLGIAYGQAKLTAQQLNEGLNASSDAEPDAIDGEWEEA